MAAPVTPSSSSRAAIPVSGIDAHGDIHGCLQLFLCADVGMHYARSLITIKQSWMTHPFLWFL